MDVIVVAQAVTYPHYMARLTFLKERMVHHEQLWRKFYVFLWISACSNRFLEVSINRITTFANLDWGALLQVVYDASRS